jgi:hypothetical protein
MAARDPRLRRAHARTVVIGAALLAAGLAPAVGHAQPVDASVIERARDLYLSAEAAMKDGRFDDAARDYGASYELSKDPALFFKIGRANERAGKCEIALIYYARYLREGKPTEQFAALTNERIAACRAKVQGDASTTPSGGASTTAPTPAPPGESGTGDPAIRTGITREPTAGDTRPPTSAGSTTAPAPGDAATGSAPTDAAAAPAGTPPSPMPIPNNRQKVAWLMGGSAIALVALGGVLAYAARSSENDVRDLYAGFAGQPPPYDSQTQKRYAELIDDGKRYQHLSWAAFGLAGAATVGAALLFTLGGEEPSQGPRVTPVVTTRSAGVSVRF